VNISVVITFYMINNTRPVQVLQFKPQLCAIVSACHFKSAHCNICSVLVLKAIFGVIPYTDIRTCNFVMLFPHNFLSRHSVKQYRRTLLPRDITVLLNCTTVQLKEKNIPLYRYTALTKDGIYFSKKKTWLKKELGLQKWMEFVTN